jgi:hypothetical protein
MLRSTLTTLDFARLLNLFFSREGKKYRLVLYPSLVRWRVTSLFQLRPNLSTAIKQCVAISDGTEQQTER